MLIDGKAKAVEIRKEVARRVKALGYPVGLAVVVVGSDPASATYVHNKEKACAEVGIASTIHRLSESVSTEVVLKLISQLSQDPETHGILVQLPLPVQVDTRRVLAAIPPEKDVDCFHPQNVGRLVEGSVFMPPCTPAGIMELLLPYDLKGKHCVIIGRSNIVGKPLALLMLKANATVTVCHSYTTNLAEITKQADVLVSAVGREGFVTKEMVMPGAIVIDVGINRDASGKLCGDVDFEAVKEIAGAITPVPGGVGPMTVAMLLKNTLRAAIY